MYALLTYFLVILGSMATCEDLFYKCCAHSEEIVHSLHLSKQFLFEIWNSEYESFFLKNTFLSTCWFIHVFDFTIGIYEHTVNSKTLQRCFADTSLLTHSLLKFSQNCLMSSYLWFIEVTNAASLCDVSVNMKGETSLRHYCEKVSKGLTPLACWIDHLRVVHKTMILNK